ncbi:MAG: hypothetical protein EPN93_02590 [Spirochaetes bacterium]|nr:MAG: hypothetical protein EPN93_02590 [Spirochaetota bacterium]
MKYIPNTEIEIRFIAALKAFKLETGLSGLEYVISSTYRPGEQSEHGKPGGAMDVYFMIHSESGRKEFAPLSVYIDLFAFLLDNWEGYAGLDAFNDQIHIHLDMRPDNVFFLEDKGYAFAVANNRAALLLEVADYQKKSAGV